MTDAQKLDQQACWLQELGLMSWQRVQVNSTNALECKGALYHNSWGTMWVMWAVDIEDSSMPGSVSSLARQWCRVNGFKSVGWQPKSIETDRVVMVMWVSPGLVQALASSPWFSWLQKSYQQRHQPSHGIDLWLIDAKDVMMGEFSVRQDIWRCWCDGMRNPVSCLKQV